MTGSVVKAVTGIAGVDAITRGGLPVGRLTLIRGPSGTGKTVFALECLFRGAVEHDQPGLFVAFEESAEQLRVNATDFEWYADSDERVGFVDARLPETVLQAGDFDLLGLLAHVGERAERLGAKRVVFDGLDVLLDLLDDPKAARREVMRLRDWVRERGLVGILTAKTREPDPRIASLDFLQFAVDCVIELERVTVERTSHRTLQVTKYRGSSHSADEHPFAIAPGGATVSTRGSVRMDHEVSEERLTSGIPQLDQLISGGFWRGSSVLVSGAPGTAKTTLAGAFLVAACERGEPSLFVSFDEGSSQIVRNLQSVGIDLRPHVASGLLQMRSFRTRSSNVELHVDRILKLVDEQGARCVVIDPLSSFQGVLEPRAAEDAATHLVDSCKERGVTLLTTSLVSSAEPLAESTPVGLSTIADAWLHLSYVVRNGERNRTLSIVKVRGTRHSNQVRELVLEDGAIRLADVFTAGGEVLLGTLRWEKERQAERLAAARRREAERKRMAVERQVDGIEQQVASLKADRASLEAELERLRAEEEEVLEELRSERQGVRTLREPRHSEDDE